MFWGLGLLLFGLCFCGCLCLFPLCCGLGFDAVRLLLVLALCGTLCVVDVYC